jgi:hypothetical protein
MEEYDRILEGEAWMPRTKLNEDEHARLPLRRAVNCLLVSIGLTESGADSWAHLSSSSVLSPTKRNTQRGVWLDIHIRLAR